MTAMGGDRFVVTLVDTRQGREEVRQWRKKEVIKSMQWLKRMNARGYDVWIRPVGEHGLALLEGLTDKDLRTLRDRGFCPAVVVETTPKRYQAWVKLSERAVNEPLRGQAAQGLAQGLGLHGANAITRADGRLAGFTNQQVQRSGGRHPFVLVSDAEGRVAPAGHAYLKRFELEHAKTREVQRIQERDRPRGHSR